MASQVIPTASDIPSTISNLFKGDKWCSSKIQALKLLLLFFGNVVILNNEKDDSLEINFNILLLNTFKKYCNVKLTEFSPTDMTFAFLHLITNLHYKTNNMDNNINMDCFVFYRGMNYFFDADDLLSPLTQTKIYFNRHFLNFENQPLSSNLMERVESNMDESEFIFFPIITASKYHIPGHPYLPVDFLLDIDDKDDNNDNTSLENINFVEFFKQKGSEQEFLGTFISDDKIIIIICKTLEPYDVHLKLIILEIVKYFYDQSKQDSHLIREISFIFPNVSLVVIIFQYVIRMFELSTKDFNAQYSPQLDVETTIEKVGRIIYKGGKLLMLVALQAFQSWISTLHYICRAEEQFLNKHFISLKYKEIMKPRVCRNCGGFCCNSVL